MTLPAGLLALVVGCVLGWLGRYSVIEATQLDALCAAAADGAWCTFRAQLIAVTFAGAWGIAAVVAGVVVWTLRGRPAALVAVTGLLAGGVGLHLFDTAWSASGVLSLLLRLPRIGEERPDPREFSA